MKEFMIHDTAEVTVTDLITGKTVLMGKTTTAGLSQSITEEDVKAGIGNATIYTLRTDKAIELNITNAVFTKEALAMTQGVDVELSQLKVKKSGYVKVKDDNGDLVVDLNELDGDIHIPASIAALTEAEVEYDHVAVTSGIAILPTGSDYSVGQEVVVHYDEMVEGESIKFKSDKFSHKYKVQLRTIAYDLDKAIVDADVYFYFPETIPSGEVELSFSAGEPISPEINFKVIKPKSSSTMGEFMEVKRS